MNKYIKRAWIFVFSVGWLIPFNLAISNFIEAEKTVANGGVNSFPIYDFAENLFIISTLWLALVICVWISLYFVTVERYKKDNSTKVSL